MSAFIVSVSLPNIFIRNLFIYSSGDFLVPVLQLWGTERTTRSMHLSFGLGIQFPLWTLSIEIRICNRIWHSAKTGYLREGDNCVALGELGSETPIQYISLLLYWSHSFWPRLCAFSDSSCYFYIINLIGLPSVIGFTLSLIINYHLIHIGLSWTDYQETKCYGMV